MPTDDEFFTPKDVDEQIDSLTPGQEHAPDAPQPEERIISHLRQYYTKDTQKQQVPLDRAWNRIVAQHQAAQQTAQRKGRLIHMQDYQSGQQGGPASRRRRTLIQKVGILAAILFVGLLVGGMVIALNAGHQSQISQKQTITASGGMPQPRPPHPITGGKCSIDTTNPQPQTSKVSLPGLYAYAVNQQSDNLLYRYDPQTKKVLWSIKICQNFYANGGATFEQNGILYFYGTDWSNEGKSGSVSYLYALNEADGSAIWGIQFPIHIKTFAPMPSPPVARITPTATIDPNAGSSPADLSMIEAPTIVNGVIYVVQRSGAVYAYNATTGSQLWTFSSERNAWATTKDGNGSILDPSRVQVVNGTVYFSIVDHLYALNAQTGKELWVHSFNNELDINQAPAIDNGTVYATAFVPGYGSVTNPDSYIYAFDTQTGTQKWVTKKLVGYLNGPVAYNGTAFVTSYAGDWYTLNPESGAIETQKTLASGGYGSPALINGVLYNLSSNPADNTLTVLNSDGSTKWSVQVSGAYSSIDDVQGGIIYISGRGTGVYAYSATDGKFLWHYADYRPQPQGQLSVTVVA